MSKKDIYISVSNEYKVSAANFLNNNLDKQLICDDKGMQIVVTVKEENTTYIEKTCEEITSLIINTMKDSILKEYILKHYSEEYPEDKESIYIYALNVFNEKENYIRNSVYAKVYNYILTNDYINIDGFVKFRIKEFIKHISMISDIALEEYLIQKDQDEFINVLKYFIDVQEEKLDYLKIHIIDSNNIILYDKNQNQIDSIIDEEIMSMVIQENLNYEDFLISTLLSMCPKKIEIVDFLKDNFSREIINTIESIFGERVKLVLQN